MSDFSTRVLDWFHVHGRKNFPWQHNVNPYRVWVSEIMLQQTQVQTVIPFFHRFIKSYPAVDDLAAAAIDDVLAHWSGLGYYARARNLHAAAKILRDNYGGEFPDELETVQALPGIGRSTAGAILALAFGQRQPILDGNVKRVLARHAAIPGWPGKTNVANTLWRLAEERTPATRVGHYTQAIMDLGASLCTRSKPACEQCPVGSDCVAFAADSVADFPGRKTKMRKPLRETTMLLAVADNAVYLERRPASGIWGGLWSFPETEAAAEEQRCDALAGEALVARERWQVLRHSFSHYDLDIQPLVLRLNSARMAVADGDDAVWYQLDQPPPGGIAAPVQKLIDRLSDRLVDHAREES